MFETPLSTEQTSVFNAGVGLIPNSALTHHPSALLGAQIQSLSQDLSSSIASLSPQPKHFLLPQSALAVDFQNSVSASPTSETQPDILTGNTRSVVNQTQDIPQNLGVLNGTQTLTDAVTSLATPDVYQFSLATASDFNLTLAAFGGDADVAVGQDVNGDGLLSWSEELEWSYNFGTIPGSISLPSLAAGTYLINVDHYSGYPIYTLNVSATPAMSLPPVYFPDYSYDYDPDNTLATAQNLGVLSGTKTINDTVVGSDDTDIYQFSLESVSDFNLSLVGVGGDADVKLIQDTNQNQWIDWSEVVKGSYAYGTLPESIAFENLVPGNYYIQVYRYSESPSYTLNVSATPPLNPPTAENFNSISGYGLVNASAAVASALYSAIPLTEVPPLNSNNWGLDAIQAPEVWNTGYTGAGVVVAVVDSGVDYTHFDLDQNIWKNFDEVPLNGVDDDNNGFIDDYIGWDFVSDDADPADFDSHGTHVAGIIAAEANEWGITGVAPNAQIMPIRVLGENGGTYEDTAAGIYYAANNGADVINLSLGSYFASPEEEAAIRYAKQQGVVVVMASGNSAEFQPMYPARYAKDWGIAVGATDINGNIAEFSNAAGITALDYIVAPGVSIYSTTPNNTLTWLDGTSMAAPHVAGTAALVINANPNLTPEELEYLLVQTATPLITA